MQGLDYAWWRPTNAGVLNAFGFVIRYLSYDPSKSLSRSEAEQLTQWGKFIVCNWETDGLGGDFQTGAQHARDAIAQAVACGKPDGYPIYFSIDENVNPLTQDEYLHGIQSVMPVGEIGDYGEAALVQHWAMVGVTHGWRTSAVGWDGGASIKDCAIVQTGYAFNGNADLDYSLSEDPRVFGGWKVGGVPLTPVVNPVEEVDMVILTFAGSPGRWLFSGGVIRPLSNGTDEPGLNAAGVKTAVVSEAFINELLVAQGLPPTQ